MTDEEYREELKKLLFDFLRQALSPLNGGIVVEYVQLIPSLASMLITLTNSEDPFNY